MNALMMVISVIAVLVGGLMLTQATVGVGVVCIGIAFAVWTRINQAAEYRREDLREANARATATAPKQV